MRLIICGCGAVAGLLLALPLGAAQGDPASPEPVVTAAEKDGGIVEITVAPDESGPPVVYRIDLSKQFVPAKERTAAIRRWEAYRFGAFICFNTNQFTGKEFCRAADPRIYNPRKLDVAGWIAAMKKARMKYAVLTTRHTSGFLLWDSVTTRFDVASSGNKTDVVKQFVKQCRAQGIAPGLYYCMWSEKRSRAKVDASAVILGQLHELATRYGEIPYFWIDMMTWAPHDLTTQQVYDAIKSVQPDTIILMNQYVQDGRRIKHFPADAINGEVSPPPAGGHDPWRAIDGVKYYLPFEFEPVSQRCAAGVGKTPWGKGSWFTYGKGRDFTPSEPFPPHLLAKWIRQAYRRGASNVLLAAAPDYTGRMRPEDVRQLEKLGRLLEEDLAKPVR